MAAAFAVLQGFDLVAEALHLPSWVLTGLVLVALALLPVVAILAWIFDLTREGLVRTPATERTPFRWTAPRTAAVGVTLIVLLTTGWLVLKPPPQNPGRVLVMPLQNRTGTPALDPLGEIAAEWIIESLVRASFVEVVDLNLALAAAASVTPGDAASTGAGTIVSGNYYREGDSLLFQVRVTRSDGTLLEALPPVRGPVANPTQGLLPLRDRVRGALAVHYDAQLSGFEGNAGAPPSYEAYRAYIDGLHHYLAGQYGTAAERFRAAVAADASFPRPLLWAAVASAFDSNQLAADSAWSRLAARETELSAYDRSHARFFRAILEGSLEEAYQSARGMLAAAPGSHDAAREVALSALRTWRPREALALLERMAAQPGVIREWDLYWYYRILALELTGDLQKALQVAREARRASSSGATNLAEAMILADLGRVSEVQALIETIPQNVADVFEAVTLVALRLRSDTLAAKRILDAAVQRGSGNPTFRRAWTLYLAGRYAESQQLADSIPTHSVSGIRNAERLGLQGALAVRRGDTLAARQSLNALQALPGVHYVEYTRARLHALLGEHDEAIRLIGRTSYDFILDVPTRIHPDFAALRGNPRFEALMRPQR